MISDFLPRFLFRATPTRGRFAPLNTKIKVGLILMLAVDEEKAGVFTIAMLKSSRQR